MAMSHDTSTSIYVNHLSCSLCTGYLSCAPIQLLPNGKWICGNCDSNTTTSRELFLESILNNKLFPCKFDKYGCKEQLVFDTSKKHENECVYRTYTCPSMPSGSCSWHGSVFQISDHLSYYHPHLVGTNSVGNRWRNFLRKTRMKLQKRN